MPSGRPSVHPELESAEVSVPLGELYVNVLLISLCTRTYAALAALLVLCTVFITGLMSRECHPARGHLFGGAGLVAFRN